MWWWVMNCVNVGCWVVVEICCSKHVINMKVWNVILWFNPWDKWCYANSGKMMWIVLSWVCYTCIYIYMCVCVCCVLELWIKIYFLCALNSFKSTLFLERTSFTHIDSIYRSLSWSRLSNTEPRSSRSKLSCLGVIT